MKIQGNMIKTLRQEKKWTIRKLSEQLLYGRTLLFKSKAKENEIQSLERKLRMIENFPERGTELPQEQAYKLAKLFEIPIDDLLIEQPLKGEGLSKMAPKLKIPTGKTEVICVTATKGGSTKTTTTSNIAAIYSEKYEYNVLAIDTDHQKNLTQTFGIALEDPYNFKNLYFTSEELNKDLLLNYIKPLDLYNSLSIIPSTKDLRTIEADIARYDNRKEVMAFLIETIRELNLYDIVLIDTNNSSPLFNSAIINASDYVLTPIAAENFHILNVLSYCEDIETRILKFNKTTQFLGIAVTHYHTRRKADKMGLSLLKESLYKDKLFKTLVRDDSNIPLSQYEGHPAVCLYPKSNASVDFKSLAKEILDNIVHSQKMKDW